MVQWIISQQDVMPGQEIAIRSDRATFTAQTRLISAGADCASAVVERKEFKVDRDETTDKSDISELDPATANSFITRLADELSITVSISIVYSIE